MRVLVLAPEPLFPSNSGGRIDALTVARALKSLGHEVHVRCFRHQFEKEFEPVEFDSYATIQRKSFFRATMAKPLTPYQISSRDDLPWFPTECRVDAVVAIQEWVLPMAREVAQVAGAMLFLRVANDEAAYLASLARDEASWKKKTYLWLEASRSRSLLRRANFYRGITHSWPISQESTPQGLAATVLAPVLYQEALVDARFGRESVLFIGALDVAHTLKGVQWFVDNVWPLVRAQIPTATFLVGGRGCDRVHVRSVLAAEGVELLGELDDPTRFYEKASVFVNPVLSGSGVNMKVGPPASAGMPYVTTPVGARGVPHLAEGMSIQDSAAGFAQEVLKLLEDCDYWTSKSVEIRSRVRKEFSQEAMAAELSSWLPRRHREA